MADPISAHLKRARASGQERQRLTHLDELQVWFLNGRQLRGCLDELQQQSCGHLDLDGGLILHDTKYAMAAKQH
eukprot:1138339-Pelagomonas_calceolata.AAC.11